MTTLKYVLLTAARNEEKVIRFTIESVLSQSLRPIKWIIVSDGSSDGTDDIVNSYVPMNVFIDFVRCDLKKGEGGFASKVIALREGYKKLQGIDYQYIGILDADVSFDPNYFEGILSRFLANEKLGIAGGFIHEKDKGHFRSRNLNSSRSVAGAIQLFRRVCYEEIGGLQPVQVGGEDWIAETWARIRGWEVEAFPGYRVLHHKKGELARGVWREGFRSGLMDYNIGSHPLFEIIKCFRRFRGSPLILGSMIRMGGFLWAYGCRKKRTVPPEFVRFLRKEQCQRIRSEIKILPSRMLKN